MLFGNWDYVEEARQADTGTVTYYSVKVSNISQVDRVARDIDALTANSDHETKSQSENAWASAMFQQFGDLGPIVSSIMGAVFFTLLLLTGHTMTRAVHERIPENRRTQDDRLYGPQNPGAGAVRIRRLGLTRWSHRSCRRDSRGHRGTFDGSSTDTDIAGGRRHMDARADDCCCNRAPRRSLPGLAGHAVAYRRCAFGSLKANATRPRHECNEHTSLPTCDIAGDRHSLRAADRDAMVVIAGLHRTAAPCGWR